MHNLPGHPFRGTLKCSIRTTRHALCVVGLAVGAGCRPADHRLSAITFDDIAGNSASGLSYGRNPTTVVKPKAKPQMKPRGAPGVAIFDYDRDGDMDIYVTNGPGKDNSLFVNQLVETGKLTFVDRAIQAGVAAHDQDSTGVCFGDIDNDGYDDLLVLGNNEPNRLFRNLGNGTFEDVTVSSGVGASVAPSVSCSMGDVNGDGFLDIVVANVFDMTSIGALVEVPFALNHHNQLLMNDGHGHFSDKSESSWITNLYLPQDAPISAPAGAATITWAITLVDYDQDGDVDLFHADDQGPLSNTLEGGIDRGLIHVFNNDGTGHFTDVTAKTGMSAHHRVGGWMGLAFADFDRDGRLDVFGANFGNYAAALFHGGVVPKYQEDDSRWFLQQPDGTFLDSFDVKGRTNTPLGWGVVAEDYDNDGDSDVIYYGGLDLWFDVMTSPAAVLRNDGRASFTRDTVAKSATDHLRRETNGVASGDLNNDGFIDIVSVSDFNLDPKTVMLKHLTPLGGDWDVDAYAAEYQPSLFAGTLEGTLSVEINSASNGNSFIQLQLVGTHEITSSGRSNRDGIGAVITVRPEGSPAADIRPLLGGSSYGSQSSLVMTFGLGTARRASVDILWPGGARNHLDNAGAGERIIFPEIPCSLGGKWTNRDEFTSCLDTSLGKIRSAHLIDDAAAARFRESMLGAFDARGGVRR